MADRFLVNLHLVLNAHLSRWRNWSVACSVQALSRSAVSDSLICPKVGDTLYIHILYNLNLCPHTSLTIAWTGARRRTRRWQFRSHQILVDRFQCGHFAANRQHQFGAGQMQIPIQRLAARRSFVAERCHYHWRPRRSGVFVSGTMFHNFVLVVFRLLRGRYQRLEALVHFVIVVIDARGAGSFAVVEAAQMRQRTVCVRLAFAGHAVINGVHVLRVTRCMR